MRGAGALLEAQQLGELAAQRQAVAGIV